MSRPLTQMPLEKLSRWTSSGLSKPARRVCGRRRLRGL
jgi:hypothetical protein